MKCFCVRDNRGKDAWEDGAKTTAWERMFEGEILHTGSFQECVSYCAGFAKAIYRDVHEITAVSSDARKQIKAKEVETP